MGAAVEFRSVSVWRSGVTEVFVILLWLYPKTIWLPLKPPRVAFGFSGSVVTVPQSPW